MAEIKCIVFFTLHNPDLNNNKEDIEKDHNKPLFFTKFILLSPK